jgi:hypothetical protein
MYNTFIINRDNVFVINDFEVLTLIYLRKGNINVASVDNSFIELEVVIKSKTLAFLN